MHDYDADSADYLGRPSADRALVNTAAHPDFRAWLARIEHIGGCAHPVHLTGVSVTFDVDTKRVVQILAAKDHPYGRLTIACGNSRASRCEPCARIHQGDTYQLVVSGVAGGKSVPESVREHPRVFVTFTAPSFGPVHRHTTDQPCRPRRNAPVCAHGRSTSCTLRHDADASELGSPLCPDCYDYEGAVLFNAHTRGLWQRLHRNLYQHLATVRGISRTKMRKSIRVAYAKVAEYQRRGTIHFHAVMRFDGPSGPADPPPAWATTRLLSETIRTATHGVAFDVPGTSVTLRFGKQLDIKPIIPSPTGEDLTERAVASYIAKYVTKPDLNGITVDRPVRDASEIPTLRLTEHSRTMLRTCWRLASHPAHRKSKLRRWAHQLGYRGHIATKSRTYSTTYRELRAARAEYRRGHSPTPATAGKIIQTKLWAYLYSGHTIGQAMFAEGIAEDIHDARQAARIVCSSSSIDDPDARR